MRIHYLIHAPFEMPGAIQSWVEKNNYAATSTHTYRGEKLPEVTQFDMLIIMGGPQSAVKLDEYPYLRDEITLTKQAIADKKAVLGICLGAQIIGEALGAKTEKSPHQEIGIYPIECTADAETDPLFKQFGKEFEVMHWHSDMPGIADGSVLLAKSAGCPKQAFRYGDRVYGFQFHLELTPELIRGMVEHCGNEIKPGKFVHTPEKLKQLNLKAINEKMHLTLDYLAKQLKTN